MCKNCNSQHQHSHKHTDNDACNCCHHEHNHEEAHCCCHHNHEHGEPPAWRTWLPIMVSALLLAWGCLGNPFSQYSWAIFVLAYLPIGIPIIKEACEEIGHGEIFNEFTLMLIATFGAFAIGEYPEAVAVLLFYSVGEYFQDRAVEHAQRDIQSLIDLRPDTATIIAPNGEKLLKAPEEVKAGDMIEVVAGGRIPLDGTLLNERAFFDTAALTGESEPRSISQGDEVSAGMIASGSVVRIKVLRPYAESALQRILNMVQDAASRKSKAEVFIRKFARIYTPIVIGLATLVAVVPPLVGMGAWSLWLYRALVFLVISCPCALVVSVPLAYFRGIGVASSYGILFKGGNYLDAVTHLTQVVFDKTGTLTTGKFSVDHVTIAKGITESHLLATVCAVERYSTHPIAKAITEKGDEGICLKSENVEEVAGLGLRAVVEGKEVVVGKGSLLSQAGIEVPKEFSEDAALTYIYCAINHQFAGMIALADQARTNAPKGIQALHNMHINTAILSGDRTAVVARLAKKLSIDSYHGDLLPEDKVSTFQHIKSESQQSSRQGLVAFVGDGINDAPVLALSDVGFAMGGAGSDAAVETADIVVQSDDPSLVAKAIMIGRRTKHLVRYNITLALGIKVAVMLASTLGYASLWAAVMADTGVALLCVANTYFIRKGKK